MKSNALACGQCGAGLPPPDATGTSFCVYCGAEHHDRSSATFASALVDRSSRLDLEADAALAGENAARIAMTEESVLTLVREHFHGIDSVFVCPHVPPKREQSARHVHADHLPERERILALYDATAFGSGDEGFVLTAKRICWKNARETANAIEWCDLDPDQISPERHRLFLGNDAIAVDEETVLDACADAFHILALSGMPPQPSLSGPVLVGAPHMDLEQTGERLTFATSTPARSPHASHMPRATSGQSPSPEDGYPDVTADALLEETPDCNCWHCRTPLWAETPQCTYCGAFPKQHGWLRTG